MTITVIPQSKTHRDQIDFLGVIFMFLGIGSLQILLDQGNSHNWFHSNVILLLAIISIFATILFLLRTHTHKNPVITLSIFKDRNFSLCTILLALYCGALFGFVTLEPIMLENLFNDTPMIAGNTMIVLGLTSAVSMGFSAFLVNRVHIKIILIAALCISAAGVFYFSTLSLNTPQSNFIVGNALFGFGMGLFMIPLTAYSLATLHKDYITEAAGLFSYGRMLGTSIGVSLLSTLVSTEAQINWSQLGTHITAFNMHFQTWLFQQHLTLQNPNAVAELKNMLSSQANMIAFNDAFWLVSVIVIALIPMVLLIKKVSI